MNNLMSTTHHIVARHNKDETTIPEKILEIN